MAEGDQSYDSRYEVEEEQKDKDREYRNMWVKNVMENGVKLQVAHAYGIYNRVINLPIAFIGEEQVLYSCG
jgi:hypothetical protein